MTGASIQDRAWLGNLAKQLRHLCAPALAILFVLFSDSPAVAQGSSDPADEISQSAPLLRTTFLLAVSVFCLSIPFSTAFAFLVSRSNLFARRFCELVIYSMLLVPAFIHVAAWDAGFGLQGWVSQAWGPGTILLDGWLGATWSYFVWLFPWLVLIQTIYFRRVPSDLERQASLDANGRQVFRFITFPLAAPGIYVSALWIMICVANEVTITDVYFIRTYAEEIYTGFALGDSLSEAQARFLPGGVLMTVLATCVWFLGISVARLQRTSNRCPNRLVDLASHRIWISSIVILFVLCLTAVPLFNLCWQAGITVQQTDHGRLRTWSIYKLMQMMIQSPFKYAQELSWSLILGQLASVTAVVLSFFLAWNQRRWYARVLSSLFFLVGLAIPAPILALAVARLLNQPGLGLLIFLYDHTVFGAWIVLTIRTFPFAFVLMNLSIRSIDRDIIDSSAIEGAGTWNQFRSIVLPLLIHQVMAIWLICLVWAMGELSATILIVPPGVRTLSIEMFNLVHYGVQDRLAGLCLSNVLMFIVITWIGLRIFQTHWTPGNES